MKQFILTKEPDNNIVRLDGSDYRYLVRVRRLAVGEFFPALLPNGEETLVEILSVDKNILTGKCNPSPTNFSSLCASVAPCLCVSSSPKTSSVTIPPIILFQAMPKGDKMDLIIRQAAEGGITEILPFISEFSLVKQTAASGQKFSRWERIIREARQQSGSKIATVCQAPAGINGLFEYWKKINADGEALGLLFHHQNGGLEQKSLHGYLNNVPKVVVLAVGPEGGFSDKEVALFLENGFKSFTISDIILRTETAALYCAAAVRILLLERDSWELKQK